MTAVSKHRVAADPGPIGLQAGYMSLLACHASRSGYHGSGRPEAARQAAACSVSMASRSACAAAPQPVKRKATGSGERSTASKASHAPGSPARPNGMCAVLVPSHGLAAGSMPGAVLVPNGMLPAAEWPQQKARPIHRRQGIPGQSEVSSKADHGTKAGWDAPTSRCHCQLACSAKERSQLVAVVVGEGCAAPRRVFRGGIGTAGWLDARIRGSVGLRHCCVAV